MPPTDSIADIDATLAAPDIITELQAEAELCRQALVEAQAEIARLEGEVQTHTAFLAVLDSAGMKWNGRTTTEALAAVREIASPQ